MAEYKLVTGAKKYVKYLIVLFLYSLFLVTKSLILQKILPVLELAHTQMVIHFKESGSMDNDNAKMVFTHMQARLLLEVKTEATLHNQKFIQVNGSITTNTESANKTITI